MQHPGRGTHGQSACGGAVRRDRRESGHARTGETGSPARESGNPPAQSRGEDVNQGPLTQLAYLTPFLL